jgi:serine/threonine-protein kinase
VALAAGTQVGGYRVEGILGRGGMATVYSARQVQHGRLVALKVLAGEPTEEFVARFRREGRLQASLEHPHVVTVFEAGESEHGLYLAMQLVSGPTLANLMQERALDATRALALLRQVASALDAAHAAGLVHRDVKPQNVLVGESDDAYLGDFGLTTLGGSDGVTATGKLVGTASYIAPEVIRGGDAVPASDRYAFAAMAFECLTGTVVYPRRTQAAILFAHTSEPPPRASGRRPELPRALDGVFERALSKQPGDRPGSAVALVDQISAPLAGVALAAPPPPGAAGLDEPTVEPIPLPDVPPPRRSRPAAWVAGGLAAVVAAALVGATLGGGDEDDAAAAPPTLAGAQALGSDLGEPGRALDCEGQAARPESSGCTILQAALPGRTVVVPADGVIRRWAVRSAHGELALAVIRPRGEDTFQVARSRHEFVGNAGVHVFDTDLAVERGDLVALIAFAGSAVGLRGGVEGGRTRRWMPELPLGEPAPPGVAEELLLRVDFIRGGQQRLPRQVTGAAAAALEPGKVVRRRSLRFTSGRPFAIALVAIGDRFALDQFLGGRRVARIDVPPDFRAGDGRLLAFKAGADPAQEEAGGVYMEYARNESARILTHFYGFHPREFEFAN